MLLVQFGSMNVFYAMSYLVDIIFNKIFFNHYVDTFFKTSVLKEVRIS